MVLAWGDNTAGQCDVPAGVQAGGVVAVAAGATTSFALLASGRVVAWGNASAGLTNVPCSAQAGVLAVAGGRDHVLAIVEPNASGRACLAAAGELCCDMTT
jgi:alpha-tubulin suppressor-like RCC1 family protein